MTKRTLFLAVAAMMATMSIAAQGQETTDSVGAQENKSGLTARLHQVKRYLDEKAMKKVDPHYIEVPEKPWMVALRYNASVFDMDYSNTAGNPSAGDGLDWKICFQPPMASSIGVWAGYRGTGIAVSKALHRKKGTTFSFSTTGAKYGVNIRLRSFDIDDVTFSATAYEGGKTMYENDRGRLIAPASIASLYINGYYVFNGRRYSQAAAYNQSVIQRRSAGSLLVGATWYMSAFDFSDDKSSAMILLSHNTGRIKMHQGNIGIGYGYNWVPLRGLVVNAMAMPTVSVYNREKVYKYDCNYEPVLAQGPTDDYGEWDPQTHTWANGKTHRPIAENDLSWRDNADSWETGSETDYSMLKLNMDLRLGIAYNWSRYFIGLQAQFNNFMYKKDDCKITLIDVYARLAMGVRL